jgi:hypothetical protein
MVDAYRGSMAALISIVLVRAVPVVDGILPINERADREERNDNEAVAEQKIAERKAKKFVCVQTLGIDWEHDHDHEKWNQTRRHLQLRMPPVGFAFLAFNHRLSFLKDCGARVTGQAILTRRGHSVFHLKLGQTPYSRKIMAPRPYMSHDDHNRRSWCAFST